MNAKVSQNYRNIKKWAKKMFTYGGCCRVGIYVGIRWVRIIAMHICGALAVWGISGISAGGLRYAALAACGA